MNYLGTAPVERSVRGGIDYQVIRGNGLHIVEDDRGHFRGNASELGKRTLYLASGLHWDETEAYMQEAASLAQAKPGVDVIVSAEYATLQRGPADLVYGGEGDYPLIDDRVRAAQKLSATTDAIIYVSSANSLEISEEFGLDHREYDLESEEFLDVDPTKFFCTSFAFYKGVRLSAHRKHALVAAEREAGVVSGHPNLDVDEQGLARISCSDLFGRSQNTSEVSRAAVRNIITHCLWAHPGIAEKNRDLDIIMKARNPHTGELPQTYEQGLDNYYGGNLINSVDRHIFANFNNVTGLVVVDGGREAIPEYDLPAIPAYNLLATPVKEEKRSEEPLSERDQRARLERIGLI